MEDHLLVIGSPSLWYLASQELGRPGLCRGHHWPWEERDPTCRRLLCLSLCAEGWFAVFLQSLSSQQPCLQWTMLPVQSKRDHQLQTMDRFQPGPQHHGGLPCGPKRSGLLRTHFATPYSRWLGQGLTLSSLTSCTARILALASWSWGVCFTCQVLAKQKAKESTRQICPSKRTKKPTALCKPYLQAAVPCFSSVPLYMIEALWLRALRSGAMSSNGTRTGDVSILASHLDVRLKNSRGGDVEFWNPLSPEGEGLKGMPSCWHMRVEHMTILNLARRRSSWAT